MIDTKLQSFVDTVMDVTGWKIIYEQCVGHRDRNGNRVMSHKRIGDIYGGFDRVTVMYGIKQCSIAIGEHENIPADMSWKEPYQKSMEQLQSVIKTLALGEKIFFLIPPMVRHGRRSSYMI